jgi:hypothetical protein
MAKTDNAKIGLQCLVPGFGSPSNAWEGHAEVRTIATCQAHVIGVIQFASLLLLREPQNGGISMVCVEGRYDLACHFLADQIRVSFICEQSHFVSLHSPIITERFMISMIYASSFENASPQSSVHIPSVDPALSVAPALASPRSSACFPRQTTLGFRHPSSVACKQSEGAAI